MPGTPAGAVVRRVAGTEAHGICSVSYLGSLATVCRGGTTRMWLTCGAHGLVSRHHPIRRPKGKARSQCCHEDHLRRYTVHAAQIPARPRPRSHVCVLLGRLRISALPPHRRLRVPLRPITSADGDETSRTTVVTGRDKGAGTPVGGKAKRRLDQQVGAGRVLPRGAAEKEMKDNTKVKQVDKKGRRCVHARHVGVWCTLGGRTTSRSDFTHLRAPRVCVGAWTGTTPATPAVTSGPRSAKASSTASTGSGYEGRQLVCGGDSRCWLDCVAARNTHTPAAWHDSPTRTPSSSSSRIRSETSSARWPCGSKTRSRWCWVTERVP